MYRFQTIETELGPQFKFENLTVHFGNKQLTKSILQEQFPFLQTQYLNQKHSTIIAKYPDNLDVADGYTWNQTNFSAVIRTADCLPLIAFNHQTKQLTNLHCGRVGLVDGILQNFYQLTNPRQFHSFFIGPHIETYEIGYELFKSLENKSVPHLFSENNKYYFSLAEFTKNFINLNFSSKNVYEVHINTLSDDSYWSYRADKNTPDRNFSFAFIEDLKT